MMANNDEKVDESILAVEYHKYIVAGRLAALTTDLEKNKNGSRTTQSACVIDLGGGALVNFLQHAVLNLQITAVE
jgi:hypothetical protein